MRTLERARGALLVAVLCASASCGDPAPAPTANPVVEPFGDAQALAVVERSRTQLGRTAAVLPSTLSPKSTGADGTWTTVSNVDRVGWTQGFFPGSMWLLFEQGGDAAWRTRADQWTRALEGQKTNTETHDLGFKLYGSFGQAWRITGDPYHRGVLLTAAASLASRYEPVAGVVSCCDWNPDWHLPLVVDTMMNLELLLWGAANGGSVAWRDMAVSHALRTAEDAVRADGSTYHYVDYDPATGAILSRGTFQGYGDETTWARGQAWAIYGFTMVYRHTRDPRMLAVAQRTADFWLARVGADMVPGWDLDGPQQQKDSSAAAIVASALLELSDLTGDAAAKARYRDAALRTLATLSSAGYLSSGTSTYGVLLHGVGHYPAGKEIDVSLVYGDYYLLEAVLRYLETRAGPAVVVPSGSTWR